MSDHIAILEFYNNAKSSVDAAGYSWESNWQSNLSFNDFSETDLLRELAWVVLCSGFKEAIVRKIFSYVSLCFCDWESAGAIVENSDICRATSLSVFKNEKKIDAILYAAHRINDLGYAALKKSILENPIAELQEFSYIGHITSWHLAKNLGLDVAKPDRHLIRISNQFGFNNAHTLCSYIAEKIGEQSKVIDIVLWRYAAIQVDAARSA